MGRSHGVTLDLEVTCHALTVGEKQKSDVLDQREIMGLLHLQAEHSSRHRDGLLSSRTTSLAESFWRGIVRTVCGNLSAWQFYGLSKIWRLWGSERSEDAMFTLLLGALLKLMDFLLYRSIAGNHSPNDHLKTKWRTSIYSRRELVIREWRNS